MYWPLLHVAFTLRVLLGMGSDSFTFSIGLPSVVRGCTLISNLPIMAYEHLIPIVISNDPTSILGYQYLRFHLQGHCLIVRQCDSKFNADT